MHIKERSQNNYDFLRLFATTCVIYFHSFALLNKEQNEPLARFTNGKINFPLITLGIFFSLSGYLIAKSTSSSSSIKNYLWKRFLRVQPLLIITCILIAVFLGAGFTHFSLHNYFHDYSTWSYFRNIFPAFGLQFTLPGVFENNVHEAGVNGSLWTLIIEERLYLLMCLFFFFKRNKGAFFSFFVLLLNILYCIHLFFFDSQMFEYFNGKPFFYSLLFLNASVLYFLKVDFSKYFSFYLITSGICILIAMFFPSFTFMYFISIPLFVNCFAQIKGITNTIGKYGDFSYGLYIFSFPIQQILISTGTCKDPYGLFALTLIITLPMAVLSWHLIEKKFLELKGLVK